MEGELEHQIAAALRPILDVVAAAVADAAELHDVHVIDSGVDVDRLTSLLRSHLFDHHHRTHLAAAAAAPVDPAARLHLAAEILRRGADLLNAVAPERVFHSDEQIRRQA